MSIHIPFPFLTPELLEIANAIAAIVKKRRNIWTWLLLIPSLSITGNVMHQCSISTELNLENRKVLWRDRKLTKRKQKKEKAEIEGGDPIYSFR